MEIIFAVAVFLLANSHAAKHGDELERVKPGATTIRKVYEVAL